MEPAVAGLERKPAVPVAKLVGVYCDVEALNALGEQIAEMAAHIEAATWRLLRAISRFDREGGWNRGFMNCAHWLTWRCQWDPVTAREKVRVARALDDLPRISEALRLGRVSYSKVRAMTRVATPASEGELLHIALNGTASQVESLVRGYRRATQGERAEEEERRHEARSLEIYTDADGMVVIRARLTPEVGAVVRKAIDGAMEQLRREDRRAEARGREQAGGRGSDASAEARERETDRPGGAGGGALGSTAAEPVSAETPHGGPPVLPGPARVEGPKAGEARCPGGSGSNPRECDGGGLHAASAEASHDSAETGGAAPAPEGRGGASIHNFLLDRKREHPEQLRADALGLVAQAALGRGLGCRERGEPFQVVVHVDEEVLAGTGEEGRCDLEGGAGVSAEAARRIACDAPVRSVQHGPDGAAGLDAGRRTRRISARLWRILQERDRHCRFPGCGRTGRLQAHHILHWARGGETRVSNLAVLCPLHHWTVHEGGYRIRGDASGALTFVRPDGSELPEVPPRPAVPSDPTASLTALNREHGVHIEPETNRVGWAGEGLDLVTAVEGIFKAEGRW